MARLFPTLAKMVAMALATQMGFASVDSPPHEEREAGEVQAQPVRTGKERLGGKASDEQRVDNCKVPLDLRGPKPRPDDCRHGASPPER
jgi:hypothetical protein